MHKQTLLRKKKLILKLFRSKQKNLREFETNDNQNVYIITGDENVIQIVNIIIFDIIFVITIDK